MLNIKGKKEDKNQQNQPSSVLFKGTEQQNQPPLVLFKGTEQQNEDKNQQKAPTEE